MVLSSGLALYGVYLLIDFFSWYSASEKVVATITGFQKTRNKGVSLPVVTFHTEDGAEVQEQVRRIDQVIYLLSRPAAGDYTTVVYKDDGDGLHVHVFGFINLIAGLICMVPLVTSLAYALDSFLVMTQTKYMIVFIGILFGGWAALKVIQRS